MIARLVDAEGVTWDEFAIETRTHIIRVPIGPRLQARFFPEGENPNSISYRVAEFEFDRRDGGGIAIYRLRSHLL